MSGPAQAAKAFIVAGRPLDAINVLLRGMSTSPDDPELNGLLAQAYLASSRPKEALDAANRAARSAPEDEWPQRLRSIALRRIGKTGESVAAALEAVRLDPALAISRRNLADAYLAARNPGDAYVQAMEAVRLAPEVADSFDALGRALLAQKRYADAEANFRRALELDPNDAVAHNNLGVALQRQGRRVEAVSAFNESARIDPSYETARRNLYSGTRALVGGGSAVFLGFLVFRLFVLINAGRNAPWLVPIAAALLVLGVVVYLRRFRPWQRPQLPPTAVAYYQAEVKRQRRADRPLVLLRLASFLVLGAIVGLAIALAYVDPSGEATGITLLLAVPVTIAWYWLSPRLWRRYVQQRVP